MLIQVDTRRLFEVDTTSYDVVLTLKRRRVSTGINQKGEEEEKELEL